MFVKITATVAGPPTTVTVEIWKDLATIGVAAAVLTVPPIGSVASLAAIDREIARYVRTQLVALSSPAEVAATAPQLVALVGKEFDMQAGTSSTP